METMVNIDCLVYNSFGVNTYVVYDSTKECLIVDPACYGTDEQAELKAFVKHHGLTPVGFVITHAHVDHVLGNFFVKSTWNIPFMMHPDGAYLLKNARQFGQMYGFSMMESPAPDKLIAEGDEIKVGNSSLQVLYTPGHADGSICLYCKEGGFVITGDVLFQGSIGRTDLPGGDFDALIKNITTKLMVLPDETVVYPGHGGSSSIGEEKLHNPFL
jgi:hydroxyacylglutathione hydrolase